MAILRNIIVLVCFAHFFVQGGAQGNFDLNDNYKWSGYSAKTFQFSNFKDTVGDRYRITQNGPEYGKPSSKKPFDGVFTSNAAPSSNVKTSPLSFSQMQSIERQRKVDLKDTERFTVGDRYRITQNGPEYGKQFDTPGSKKPFDGVFTSNVATRSNVKTSLLSSSQMQSLERQLRTDEGEEHSVYLDTEKKLTFGVGHLITKNDPEYGKPVGTPVRKERVEALFKTDVAKAVKLTQSKYGSVSQTWPGEVKEVMVNMAFNLGGKLDEFKKLNKALNDRDWQTAADEMKNSKWYGQVKKRGERLVERMRNVKEE